MAFKVYLKDNIGNNIQQINENLPKQFIVQSLQIADGFLVKGDHRLPITSILFIEEV